MRCPLALRKKNIQIWTSPDNYRYKKAKVAFDFSESIEKSPFDVRDDSGQLVSRSGQPVRILQLSGLNLRSKYVLLTTDFSSGHGDFSNSGTALLKAMDERGQEIPGVFASGGTVWLPEMVDFRKSGLMFDYGFGSRLVTLDTPNASGRDGFVAFTAGRNSYLPGALCETEPEVQAFWFSCLDEMIAAGVDGVDFREENHSTHTDFPQEYGFNPTVLKRCSGLQGDLLENIARVRGDAYTEFLRACKQRLTRCGKRMRYHLQLDFFRPAPPAIRLLAYPANIHFDWQRWLNEGLMDEAALRFYQMPFDAIFTDTIAQSMIAMCRKGNIPLTVNRYMGQARDQLPSELHRVRKDGHFAGFIFYETQNFLRFDASGRLLHKQLGGAECLETNRKVNHGKEKAHPLQSRRKVANETPVAQRHRGLPSYNLSLSKVKPCYAFGPSPVMH